MTRSRKPRIAALGSTAAAALLLTVASMGQAAGSAVAGPSPEGSPTSTDEASESLEEGESLGAATPKPTKPTKPTMTSPAPDKTPGTDTGAMKATPSGAARAGAHHDVGEAGDSGAVGPVSPVSPVNPVGHTAAAQHPAAAPLALGSAAVAAAAGAIGVILLRKRRADDTADHTADRTKDTPEDGPR